MIHDRRGWFRRELRCSVYGGAWHGPSLLEALADVSFAQAVARPIAGAHTIAELAHHSAGWMEEVCRRLDGSPPAMPGRGDWPGAPPGSQYEWECVVQSIGVAATALDEALGMFPVARLEAPVGTGEHDAPLGTGVTFAAMINGVIQHNGYHAGQIVLLGRAAR